MGCINRLFSSLDNTLHILPPKQTNWAYLKYCKAQWKGKERGKISSSLSNQPTSKAMACPKMQNNSLWIRCCRKIAFWGNPVQGFFSFQCFRLSWPTGMWSRHTFNDDVMMVLTGTGECKRCNVRSMSSALLTRLQFNEKATDQSTSLQAHIFHYSDAIPVRLWQFLWRQFILPL